MDQMTKAFVAPSFTAIAQARLRDRPAMIYTDTEHRKALRTLLDGAALAGAEVVLTFIKKDGSLRFMRCAPVFGGDGTARFYTVKDLDLTDEAHRPLYRRVCLDTVASVAVSYTAS